MGQAADLLARLLGVFVVLPVPMVNYLDPGELSMAVGAMTETGRVSGVCQGFIGCGIAGEALLVIGDAEVAAGSATLESRDAGKVGSLPIADIISKLKEEIAARK